jgi:hypothetical protein
MQGVTTVVPAETQRQDGAEHRDGAEQIDGPEAASIAIAEGHGPSIECRAGRLDGIDQRPKHGWGCGAGDGRRHLEPHPDQQKLLDHLMKRHGQLRIS